MNGIEKITARIAAEAGAEAEAVKAQAQAKADEIRAAYEKKAQEEYSAAMRIGTAADAQRVQSMGNTARLEARKTVLSLKQELIASAYDRAKEKILSLPENEYVAFLAALAGKASISGDEQIVLNEADKAKLGQAIVDAANAKLSQRGLEPKLVLAEQAMGFSGGLMLRKGAVEVNCTLDSLLELSRNSLDAEIAAVLFA